MENEERQNRYKQLMNQPVNTLIELIIKLEDDVKETREYRKRMMAIRNLATPPEERRGKVRPKKEE